MRITTAYGGVQHIGVGQATSPRERPSDSWYKTLAQPDPQPPDEVTVGDETIPYAVFLARLGGG